MHLHNRRLIASADLIHARQIMAGDAANLCHPDKGHQFFGGAVRWPWVVVHRTVVDRADNVVKKTCAGIGRLCPECVMVTGLSIVLNEEDWIIRHGKKNVMRRGFQRCLNQVGDVQFFEVTQRKVAFDGGWRQPPKFVLELK